MLTAAKYIGAGLACSGLIGAGVGIGVNFSSLISLKKIKIMINIIIKIYKWLGFKFIYLLDMILLILVVSYFINDFFNIYFLIIDKIYGFINLNEVMCFMSNNVSNASNVTQNTNTQIIHDDGSWSNAIRSLFIYGSGGYRLYLTRGGSPGSRFAITGGTLLADNISRVITNSINDPSYITNHWNAWRFNSNGSSASVTVNRGGTVDLAISQAQAQAQAQSLQAANQAVSQTSSQNSGSNMSNSFISGGNGEEDITEKLLNNLMDYIKPFLEPVQVTYSNEVLANQIYGISIMLFILSVVIIVLLFFFIINTVIFTYSDRIMNYFSNKYIRWYININKKFIGVELFLSGASLLYFMYILTIGIRFIATHPITFS